MGKWVGVRSVAGIRKRSRTLMGERPCLFFRYERLSVIRWVDLLNGEGIRWHGVFGLIRPGEISVYRVSLLCCNVRCHSTVSRDFAVHQTRAFGRKPRLKIR